MDLRGDGARFGIDAERLQMPILSCSGGWRTRAKLCAVLLQEPNLLILDEPTNFLDLRTQLLLAHFLSSWNGAALVVSHDRAFYSAPPPTPPNSTAGNSSLRRAHRRRDGGLERRRRAPHAPRRQPESKTKQLQRFVDSNRANASTASQARSKAKQIERLNDEKPLIPSSLHARATVRVPQVERRDGPACQIDSLQVGYGETVIANCQHLEILRGERLAIMGDNGRERPPSCARSAPICRAFPAHCVGPMGRKSPSMPSMSIIPWATKAPSTSTSAASPPVQSAPRRSSISPAPSCSAGTRCTSH